MINIIKPQNPFQPDEPERDKREEILSKSACAVAGSMGAHRVIEYGAIYMKLEAAMNMLHATCDPDLLAEAIDTYAEIYEN